MAPGLPAKDGSKRPPAVPAKGEGGGLSSRIGNALRGGNHKDGRSKRAESQRSNSTGNIARTDVIDRMDLSGLGASLFHHDSPYDACSPHSNRNARRAPVNAFDYSQDPMAGGSQPPRQGASGSSNGRPGLSPLAQATMRKMSDSAQDVADYTKGANRTNTGSSAGTGRSRSGPVVPVLGRTDSAAASLLSPTYENGSTDGRSLSETSQVDRDVDAERNYQYERGYMTQPSNVSKGRSDVANPMADIWGVTSEPWQDFAAPAQGKQTKALRKKARDDKGGNDSSDDLPSAASSVLDMEAVMTGKPTSSHARSESTSKNTLSPLAAGGDGAPKRNKSLIKRLRNARQNPNVPPPEDEPAPIPSNDNDAQYYVNGNGSRKSPSSPHGLPGILEKDPNRPSTRRIRSHQHSPSMPMQTSPPVPSKEQGYFGGPKGSQSNGHIPSPNGEYAPLRSPDSTRDRSTSAGYASGDTSSSNGNGSADLQRTGSLFNRLRVTRTRSNQQAAAAR